MKAKILDSIEDAIRATKALATPTNVEFIDRFSDLITQCFQEGGKLIIAGNGGSLCDAAHFAEELTGYFRGERQALPAIALSEPGHITCTGNDAGFEYIFSRGVEAFGKPGDIFVGLTTSGNSPNIVQAFAAAKRLQLHTVAFLGKGGGKLKGVADLELSIDDFNTSDRIQEAHMAAIHITIEMVEAKLFSSVLV